MKVLVSGSTGLVGSALCDSLTRDGHTVVRLVRSAPQDPGTEVPWSPAEGTLDAAKIEGFDAVVHLAGENIAKGRWTRAKKARIRDSRVKGTALLAEKLAGLEHQPAVWVSASAIGYYGSRGDETLREDALPGKGFLADVCKEWEAATEPAEAAGIRVVKLRTGVVLSTKGGALATMLTPFKMGAGGVVGPGTQYMSWIDLDDEVGAIRHCLTTEACRGPVNAAAPNPVTNKEFTKALGSVLHRPTFAWMPSLAVRTAFGEMADELLLSSTRVEPAKLLETGFEFQFSDVTESLRHQLAQG